jgi:hypothetical protein
VKPALRMGSSIRSSILVQELKTTLDVKVHISFANVSCGEAADYLFTGSSLGFVVFPCCSLRMLWISRAALADGLSLARFETGGILRQS